MNWLDLVIIVVLAITTFLGLKRGFIQAVVPLIGVIVAISLAGTLHSRLADSFGFIDNESLQKIIAFALILIAVSMLVYLISTWVRKLVGFSLLGWMDRQGGAVFGFIVGWLICSMIVVVVARYAPDIPEELDNSQVDQWVEVNLDGVREGAYNTIDESALATFQIDTFPVILGLLPGDFDVVEDWF